MVERYNDHFECSIILDNNTPSKWFPMKSGVRQGCILSPILFLVFIDWPMRKTTSDKPRGIQWNLFSHRKDLDFADDFALLSTNRSNLRERTARLETYATQVLRSTQPRLNVNATPTQPITASGDALEFLDDFTYLGSLICSDNGAQRTSKLDLGKHAVHLSDFIPAGSHISTVLRPSSDCITAT